MNAPGHTIELLEGGKNYFPALHRAIDQAKSEIRVEVYTFRFDNIGTATLERLADAVRRGVRVYMTADGLGSPELNAAGVQRVLDMGVQLAVFRPPRFMRLTKLHGRLHRKIVTIDRATLFLGGLNMSDEYAGDDEIPGAFYDLAARVQGPVVEEAASLTEMTFAQARMGRGERVWTRLMHIKRRKPAPPRPGGPKVQLVGRDDVHRQRAIEAAYRRAFRDARESILLAHAYFLPSRGFLSEIARAARRGVTVDIILQGKAEHPVLRWAERRLYDRLMRAGVCIHEYQPRLLHAKVAVVDGVWSTIGSSNLDPWSLISNLEANLLIEDERFAADLKRVLKCCVDSDCMHFESRLMGPWSRMLSALAYQTVMAVFVLTGGRRVAW